MCHEKQYEIWNYVRDVYRRVFAETYNAGYYIGMPHASIDTLRRTAQRSAIDQTYVNALVHYHDQLQSSAIEERDIWDSIGRVHKINVASLGDFNITGEEEQLMVMQRCETARQSWVKAGGHSFERYISRISTTEMQANEIRFIMQSELTDLIKHHKLTNTSEDIRGLCEWGKDFDLYAIQTIHNDTRVFGCIQSKTSIRDRVGRDAPFSKNAMDSLFWSVAVTLNGSFLNMEEFQNMVNGGGSYRTNGWHGMYAMCGVDNPCGRIFKIDDGMQLFANHAVQAAKQFISDRRLLNNSWMPQ